MTWVAAAPSYAPAYAPPDHVVRYGGFWRRYWGLYVDQTLVGLIFGIVATGIFLLGGLLISATATCRTYQSGGFVYQSCSGSEGLSIAISVIVALVGIAIWYRIIPRRLAEGATPGMHQMGLEVQNARDGLLIGLGAAIARSLLPGLLQVGGMAVVASVFFFSFDPGEPVQSYWWFFGLAIGLAVACYGPALLTLVDRRQQTLYDKIVGSVVVEEREVNWWAVASFGCAMTYVLAPLAIVFGHIGLHQTGKPHNRRAGHGLAAWGTGLGYVLVIGWIVLLAIVFAAGSPN